MLERYFHGGARVYDRLEPGQGMDGIGIYLTSNRRRAEMYARSAEGSAGGAVTEVKVDFSRARVWDDDAEVDLRDFTDEPWVHELVAKYGPRGTIKNGQNARIYLGWSKDNRELRTLGYQAIKRYEDLVVLDPKIIVYDRKPRAKRTFRDVGHTAEGTWGRAGSGILFTTGRKMLLLLRAPWVMEPGTWGIPGGAIPVDQHGRPMDPLASARREAREEIGRVPRHKVVEKFVFRRGDFRFTTYVARVEREFTPTLNDESEDFRWWDPDRDPPLELHHGVLALLENRSGRWE